MLGYSQIILEIKAKKGISVLLKLLGLFTFSSSEFFGAWITNSNGILTFLQQQKMDFHSKQNKICNSPLGIDGICIK